MLTAGLAALAATGLSIRSGGHVGGCVGSSVHAILHQVLKETSRHAIVTTSVLAAVFATAAHVLTGVGHILYTGLRK